MNKQKAIDEFREYCQSLCASDNHASGFVEKLSVIQGRLSNFQDNVPLINERASAIIEKYDLNRDDVWSDFREVIVDVFHREVLLKT